MKATSKQAQEKMNKTAFADIVGKHTAITGRMGRVRIDFSTVDLPCEMSESICSVEIDRPFEKTYTRTWKLRTRLGCVSESIYKKYNDLCNKYHAKQGK